jgi:hypothetical protein
MALLIIAPFGIFIFSVVIPLNGLRFLVFRLSCPSLRIWKFWKDIIRMDTVLTLFLEELNHPLCFFPMVTSQADFAVLSFALKENLLLSSDFVHFGAVG